MGRRRRGKRYMKIKKEKMKRGRRLRLEDN
jgi:hypothetical protein